jgi:predicted PurR-regulated permease PerM
MNEPAPPGPAASGTGAAGFPPPPFIRPHVPGQPPAFAPVSPRVVLLIVAALVLGLLLWMARDAVRPFIVGLLFVYLLDPLVRRLAATGLRRSLAILVVYVGALVAFTAFLWVTVGPLIDEMLRFVADFPALAEQLSAQFQRLYDLYSHLELPAALREWIDQIIAGIGSGGGGGGSVPLDLSWLLPIVSGAGSLIGAAFAYLILPVFVFYLLKDRVALTASFDRSIPDAWRFDVWAVIRSIERVFGQWVRGQLILGFAVGIFTYIGLLILSQLVDPVFGRYAVLLSIIAGVLELVPIIGPIISAVPAVLLAATAGPVPVAAALGLYLLVQQVENNLLVPKIQGDAVELHPAIVMAAIIIGGSLAGLLGAILALPVTAAGRDVVRYLFRRMSPDDPRPLADTISRLGPLPPRRSPGPEVAVPAQEATRG